MAETKDEGEEVVVEDPIKVRAYVRDKDERRLDGLTRQEASDRAMITPTDTDEIKSWPEGYSNTGLGKRPHQLDGEVVSYNDDELMKQAISVIKARGDTYPSTKVRTQAIQKEYRELAGVDREEDPGFTEGPEATGFMDEWGPGQGKAKVEQSTEDMKDEAEMIDVNYKGYSEIKHKDAKAATRAFMLNWKDQNILDSGLPLRLAKSKSDKVLIGVKRNGKDHVFPAWMLKKILTVKSVDMPATELDGADIDFDDLKQKWELFMKRLVIDDFGRPEMSLEKKKNRETEKEVKNGVMVDLDKVPRSENDVRRKQVARVVGLLEMKKGEPKVKVEKNKFGLMMQLEKDEIKEVALVADFMKAIPDDVSSMGEGAGQHWSMDNFSVDESSTADEWQKFIDNIKIKGRVKRESKKA